MFGKKTKTLPDHLPTENFRLTATTKNDDTVTVIVCGAPDSFEGAKTLGSVAQAKNILSLLHTVDADRLAAEMGVDFDDNGDDL